MSSEAHAWAKRGDTVCPCAGSKDVLKTLGLYAGDLGFAYPAIKTIANEVQRGERQVKRLLMKLVQAGMVVRYDVNDVATGRQRTCAYFLPYERPEPSPQQLAAYERQVGGRVTRMTPSLEGVADDTGEGVIGDTPGVTSVSPLRIELKQSGTDVPSAGACATDEDPFEALVAAWPVAGLDNTNIRAARAAFEVEVCALCIDPWRIVQAARDYAAAPETMARTYAPPGLDKWLSRQGFLGRLRVAKAPRLAGGEPDLFASVPADVRATVVGPKGAGERFARSYLDPCGWDAERRALLPANGIARDKLAGVLPLLKGMGVVLGEVRKGVA